MKPIMVARSTVSVDARGRVRLPLPPEGAGDGAVEEVDEEAGGVAPPGVEPGAPPADVPPAGAVEAVDEEAGGVVPPGVEPGAPPADVPPAGAVEEADGEAGGVVPPGI